MAVEAATLTGLSSAGQALSNINQVKSPTVATTQHINILVAQMQQTSMRSSLLLLRSPTCDHHSVAAGGAIGGRHTEQLQVVIVACKCVMSEAVQQGRVTLGLAAGQVLLSEMCETALCAALPASQPDGSKHHGNKPH